MNELTSSESLQQILDRRARNERNSALASVAIGLVIWILVVGLMLGIAVSMPPGEPGETTAESPPVALGSLTYLS